jgi:hypothetical protein
LDPLFPVPFLQSEWIPSIIDSLAETMPLRPKTLAFRSLQEQRECLKRWPRSPLKLKWDNPEYVKHMHKLGVRKFEIIVDLRYSKNCVKREICEWVDGLDDTGIKKFAVKKGKAAMPFWFRLKELSAFRFSQKNISYQRAQKFLDEYKEKSGSVQNDKVYPIYQSQGAWSDAVNRAKRHIIELFPR